MKIKNDDAHIYKHKNDSKAEIIKRNNLIEACHLDTKSMNFNFK